MKARRTILLVAVLVAALAAAGIFLYTTGFFQHLSSPEDMAAYIDGFSPFGQILFFLLQLLSVIVAPIPSNLSAAAGAMLFGMWETFALTFSAVLLGSMIVFLLARQLGRPFADRFVGRHVSEKYLDIIQRKQDPFLVLVFLMPFFPDDIICILAGLTTVPTRRFFLIALFTRPWGLLVSCAVGSATVAIPWWGMVLIGLAAAAVFVVGMKYGDVLEARLLQRFGKEGEEKEGPPTEA